MRKFIPAIINYNQYGPTALTPDVALPLSIFLPTTTTNNANKVRPSFFYFPPVPIIDISFDFATLCVISGLLLLSLLSLFFIIHLRSHYLHNFNSLWAVRLLLVLSTNPLQKWSLKWSDDFAPTHSTATTRFLSYRNLCYPDPPYFNIYPCRHDRGPDTGKVSDSASGWLIRLGLGLGLGLSTKRDREERENEEENET